MGHPSVLLGMDHPQSCWVWYTPWSCWVWYTHGHAGYVIRVVHAGYVIRVVHAGYVHPGYMHHPTPWVYAPPCTLGIPPSSRSCMQCTPCTPCSAVAQGGGPGLNLLINMVGRRLCAFLLLFPVMFGMFSARGILRSSRKKGWMIG